MSQTYFVKELLTQQTFPTNLQITEPSTRKSVLTFLCSRFKCNNQSRMTVHSFLLASTSTSGVAPGTAGTLDRVMEGKEGGGFVSGYELLFARSQLPHWWLPLPRLAQTQRGKATQLLCDGSFRHQHTDITVRGGKMVFCPIKEKRKRKSQGEELTL